MGLKLQSLPKIGNLFQNTSPKKYRIEEMILVLYSVASHASPCCSGTCQDAIDLLRKKIEAKKLELAEFLGFVAGPWMGRFHPGHPSISLVADPNVRCDLI